MLKLRFKFLLNFLSIILLVISEKDFLADDEKFLEIPMNKILYIHGFDQVPGFKTFPLIPLDVEHLLPIRIYRTNSATKSLFHRLRISYKVNGPLVEQLDLFVKMKIKILPRKKLFKNMSSIVLVGKGNHSKTIFFGCQFWLDSFQKFHSKSVNILILVSFIWKICYQMTDLLSLRNVNQIHFTILMMNFCYSRITHIGVCSSIIRASTFVNTLERSLIVTNVHLMGNIKDWLPFHFWSSVYSFW